MTNKVRWGVIGATSRIATEALLPAIAQGEHSELVAVASRSRESAAEVAAKYGADVRAYGDYDSLIADDAVDVIYNPLPNNMHVGWAIEAMNNGKHVLCEQPLALNAREAAEMVETAEDNGVILSEAFMYCYHPLQRDIDRVIAEGTIGEVRLVRASFSFVQQADDYRRDPGMGGGALLDVGSYCVHIARRAFGREPGLMSAKSDYDAATGVDTTTTAQLDFTGGGMALMDCSFAMTFRASYEIVGATGAIAVPKFFLLPGEAGEYTITCEGDTPQTHPVAPGNMYAGEVDSLSRKVRGEDVFLLPAEDGLYNMRVLDAIAASARSGQKEAL